MGRKAESPLLERPASIPDWAPKPPTALDSHRRNARIPREVNPWTGRKTVVEHLPLEYSLRALMAEAPLVEPIPVVIGHEGVEFKPSVSVASVHDRATLTAGRITERLSIEGGLLNSNRACVIVGDLAGEVIMQGNTAISVVGEIAEGTTITVRGRRNYFNYPKNKHPLPRGTYVVKDGQLKPFVEEQTPTAQEETTAAPQIEETETRRRRGLPSLDELHYWDLTRKIGLNAALLRVD